MGVDSHSAAPTSPERLAHIQEELKKTPDDPEMTINVGEALLRQGRVEEAIAHFERAIELDPRYEFRSLYWEWLGFVRESQGKTEEALAAYRQWLENDFEKVEPLERLGDLLVKLQWWTDFLLLTEEYERRARQSQDADGMESLALYKYVLDRLEVVPEAEERAIDICYQALARNSDSPSLRYLLGLLLLEQAHYEAARAEFEQVLRLDPEGTWVEKRFSLWWDSATAGMLLAQLALLRGRSQEALRLYLNSQSPHDDESEGLLSAAEVLLDHHRYQEVLELLGQTHTSGLSTERFQAEALLGMGYFQESEHRFRLLTPKSEDEESEPEYRPKAVVKALKEVEAYLEEGAPEKALGRLRRSRSRHWELSARRAELSAQLGQMEQAIEDLEDVLQERPRWTQGWAMLEEFAFRTGRRSLVNLARCQKLKLAHEQAQGFGILVPLVRGDGLVGLRIEARAMTGSGEQIVTGDGRRFVEGAARLAHTLLRADWERLGVVDPRRCDLHLHAHALAESNPERVSEDDIAAQAGVGVVMCCLLALKEKEIPCRALAVGRVDLSGRLGRVTGAAEAASRLARLGYEWDYLVASSELAGELLRMPTPLWLEKKLLLGEEIAELERLLEDEFGTHA